MMIERILYLRKPVEQFLTEQNKTYLLLEKKEWDHCELLLTVLFPFKKASDRLQTTRRPTIDAVFWCYETLFNELDDIFTTRASKSRPWIQELKHAVDRMCTKLRKYYSKTDDTFVYGDSAILHPCGKIIFMQNSWEKELADKGVVNGSSKIINPNQVSRQTHPLQPL